jgi:hypothetical protein
MKKLLLLILLLAGIYLPGFSQNPFESLGVDVLVVTLSNGKY